MIDASLRLGRVVIRPLLAVSHRYFERLPAS